ncbi:MAG: hypothetical protein ACYTDX_09175, partial [Planctomycetota bacterium]
RLLPATWFRTWEHLVIPWVDLQCVVVEDRWIRVRFMPGYRQPDLLLIGPKMTRRRFLEALGARLDVVEARPSERPARRVAALSDNETAERLSSSLERLRALAD